MVCSSTSSFPLQTGPVYHLARTGRRRLPVRLALACAVAGAARTPAGRPASGRAATAHRTGGASAPRPARDPVPRRRAALPRAPASRRSTRPGHKLGKGAPGRAARVARRHLPQRRPRHGRRRGGHARVHAASSASPRTTPPRRGARTAPGSSSTARPAASTPSCSRCAAPGDTVDRARATRTSPCSPGSSSPARCRSTWSRRSTRVWGIPLNVRAGRRAAALAEHPEAQGALRHLAHLQRPRRRPRRRSAALAHDAGMPFVTDQAWGPHLRFCPELPVDAMTRRRRRRRGQHAQAHQRHHAVLGAHGARRARQPRAPRRHGPHDPEHEPAGAHVRQHRRRARSRWRRAAPSSGAAPSSSADWARDAASTSCPACAAWATRSLARDGVAEFDPTRLTISACDLGHSGYELETILRDDYRIAVEAADPLNVVLNVTYGDSRDDLELLVGALARPARRATAARPAAAAPPPAPACSPARRPSRARCSRRATPFFAPSVAAAAGASAPAA